VPWRAFCAIKRLQIACPAHGVSSGRWPGLAVLFYIYCDDVEGLRNHLLASGVKAGPIQTPFYAPSGEFRIEDPDGYVIMVTHT